MTICWSLFSYSNCPRSDLAWIGHDQPRLIRPCCSVGDTQQQATLLFNKQSDRHRKTSLGGLLIQGFRPCELILQDVDSAHCFPHPLIVSWLDSDHFLTSPSNEVRDKSSNVSPLGLHKWIACQNSITGARCGMHYDGMWKGRPSLRWNRNCSAVFQPIDRV